MVINTGANDLPNLNVIKKVKKKKKRKKMMKSILKLTSTKKLILLFLALLIRKIITLRIRPRIVTPN